MIYFLGEVYPYVCVLAPCIICQVIMSRRNKSKVSFVHLIWSYIFMIYVSMVFSVAGIGSIWDFGKFGDLIRGDEINFIPFVDGFGMGHILNAVMFMPLGFLLPFIWKRHRNIFKVAATGACLSFAIEVCQLFNRRASDIDDLLMNTLGAVIGFGIWAVYCRISGEKDGKRKSARTLALAGREPEVYLIAAVLGRFFLYNWRALLEFI